MALVQLVYYSRNQLKDDDKGQLRQLRDILSVAREKNTARGITGYLIFDQTWFVQILEGERAVVHEAYQRIATDPRHAGVTMVETREVTQRTFGEWSMGGAMRNLDQQEVFLSHGIGGAIEPAKLSGSKILALARDLRDLEVNRKATQRSAA